MTFLKVFLLFWVSSILGWIVEVIVCSIADKKLVNRGFLIGPYCPIYGCGALIMLTLSSFRNNLFVCFIMALFLCSVLEYITSYVMERLFQIRWWDYSNDSFNINGRICLRNAIGFGALGVIFTRYISPFYYNIVNNFSYNLLLTISIIILVITLIDIFISFNAMNSIKNIISKDLSKYKNKDATLDIKKLIKKKVLNFNFLEKRLISTYHLIGKEKDYLKNKIKEVNSKTKNDYKILLVFLFLGIVIGLILSFGLELESYKIIVPFAVSISVLMAITIIRVRSK